MAKTDKDHLDDAGLEAFFDAGRKASPVPSEALMTAILQDAAAQMPGPAATVPTRRRSFWQDLVAQIGGWPALAGMATATVAGVWIGFAAPVQLETLSGGVILAGDYSTTETIYTPEDLAPSFFGSGFLTDEEG